MAAQLTTLLHDSEPEVAKDAAFAVGNLAFHSDLLVSRLRNSVAPLVDLLEGDNDRTQSNAAGNYPEVDPSTAVSYPLSQGRSAT